MTKLTAQDVANIMLQSPLRIVAKEPTAMSSTLRGFYGSDDNEKTIRSRFRVARGSLLQAQTELMDLNFSQNDVNALVHIWGQALTEELGNLVTTDSAVSFNATFDDRYRPVKTKFIFDPRFHGGIKKALINRNDVTPQLIKNTGALYATLMEEKPELLETDTSPLV